MYCRSVRHVPELPGGGGDTVQRRPPDLQGDRALDLRQPEPCHCVPKVDSQPCHYVQKLNQINHLPKTNGPIFPNPDLGDPKFVPDP